MFDSRVLDVKHAMDVKHQYDGNDKDGESWKSRTRDYFVGRIPILKWLLKWAEDFGVEAVTKERIMSLYGYIDEDPGTVNHLLWAYLSVNLTKGAREIFSNVDDSNGLEVWRRMHKHIFSKNESRRAGFYRLIHNPRAAKGPADVPSALEEWDTNQRLYRQVGGTPLRIDELKETILELVPWTIRKELILKLRDDTSSWTKIKHDIIEHARLLTVYGGKGNSNLMLTEEQEISEAFWVATDDLDIEEVVMELNSQGNMNAVTINALMQRRNNPAWKGKGSTQFKRKEQRDTRRPQGGANGDQGAKRLMLCANCGKPGHRAADCKEPKLPMSERLCFKCGKPGHPSIRCPLNSPVKAIETQEGGEDKGASIFCLYESDIEIPKEEQDVIIESSINVLRPQRFIKRHTISGAKYFKCQMSDDSDDDSEDPDDDDEDGDTSGEHDLPHVIPKNEGQCIVCPPE